MPTVGPVRVDIGTVLPGEEQTDFSADLPAASARRAELSWLGGTFEGPTSPASGSSAPTRRRLRRRTVRRRPVRRHRPGRRAGRHHRLPGGHHDRRLRLRRVRVGGFGSAASTYTWTSDPLTSGNWSYAVVPYDSAGNLGTAAVTGVTIIVPPLPPALDADNMRLTYTYNASDHEVTLNWHASPG